VVHPSPVALPVVSGRLACSAVVGVVAGVCVPPDFGMTVFLVCGMLDGFSLANAGADNSSNATCELQPRFRLGF
jgi:hypothetical protein